MKVLIIGATGRLGSYLVQYALEKGHEVTAFARNIEDLPHSHPALTRVKGDVLYPTLIEAALPGHDAVLSVIGVRKFRGAVTLLSRGMRHITDGMGRFGIRRLITVTGAGILQENEQQLIMESLSFPPNLQNVSLDHRRVYHLLQETGLDWTIVCPAFMVRRPPTGEFLTAANHYPKGARNEIPLADVADFMTDELVSNQHLHQRVGIGQVQGEFEIEELGI